MTTKTTLLPCPFCGSKSSTGRNYGIGGSYVRCSNISCPAAPEIFIGAESGPSSSLKLDEAYEKAATLWNTRYGKESAPCHNNP